MFTVKEFRRLADECEEDARRASSPKCRDELLESAQVWRELAQQRELDRDQFNAALMH